jgi:phosphatidylinositol-3-phosphatase
MSIGTVHHLAAAVSLAVVAAVVPTGTALLPPRLPPVGHVFVIILENKEFDTTFGPDSPAHFLRDTLARQGALLRQYYGIGHSSLDNYVAMISGIAPNPATQGDCGVYSQFIEKGMAPDGQPIGEGCVYPAHVKTIADQLDASHRTWKAYMEDMGKDPSRERAPCGHAAIGTTDRTRHATPDDQYADKHDPFVYFHSVVDAPGCATHVVPLTPLARDLGSLATTPAYVFVTPNLCHDGHDQPCRDGEPGGLESTDRFLAEWVPRIMDSPAYRKDGLIIITWDEAPSAHKEACCHEPTGPNTASPGAGGPGGGRTGAVLLSPFIKPGTVSDTPYNHYSMLRSVEDLFGLRHLGYAGQRGLAAFGTDVFTAARNGR